MHALRLHAIGDLRSEVVPEPVAGPGEELVRMTAVGLCGSDLHWYVDGGTGGAPLSQPLILGHEMAGVVATGPLAGLRVAVEPSHACGRCDPCRAGHGNLCPNVRFAGYAPTDGGLRERMAWPARLLLPIPDTIDDEEAALLEPLGIGLHAIDLADVRKGSSAAVIGCGPIGLLLIRALRAVGASRILATDRLLHRVQAALDSGASEALLASDGPPSSEAQPAELAEREPVDVAFEVSGEDDGLASALTIARIGGKVLLVGIPSSGRHSFRASLARGKGLTLIASRRMKTHHMARAIELVDDGLVDFSGLITATYPLSDGAAAFEELASRSGLKIVVRPSA